MRTQIAFSDKLNTVEVQETPDCGTQTLGVVDKGFTEVLTNSDGEHYGNNRGEVLIKESDKLKLKYQRRFKLTAMAKKKPWVHSYNLGRKRLNKQSNKHQSQKKSFITT